MSKAVFGSYSKYYNLLYHDKDYKSEADYVREIIRRYKSDVSTVFDLGCGTGIHSEMISREGYTVHGIDISHSMIEQAKKKSSEKLHFEIGDVRNYTCNKKFDAVISLFHVASYQTSNVDIEQYFKTAANLLKKGGIFIFDFWYGPAVLTDRPSYRKKVMEDEQTKIIRFTTPKMFANKNVCDVHFNVLVIDKSTQSVEEINETHSMRYFFIPELLVFLQNEGFSVVKEYKWMTFEKLGFDTWNGLVVARLN